MSKGKFQRRDSRLDVLTQSAAFSEEGNLFAELGKHEIFVPTKTHLPVTVKELGVSGVQAGFALRAATQRADLHREPLQR